MEHQSGMSRRSMLGAVGGVVAGGLVAPGLVRAGVDGSSAPNGAWPTSDVHPSVVPAVSAATSYVNYGVWRFTSPDPTRPAALQIGYLSAPGSGVLADVDLPVGTVITELTLWATNSTGASVDALFYGNAFDSGDLLEIAIPIPNGTSFNPITYNASSITIRADYFYSVLMFTPTTSAGIRGVRIGYRNTSSFVPVTPYRCYDSRVMGTTLPLVPNSSRTIDVTKKIDASTGAVIGSGMIPSTARAVTFNMVAAGATGGNYFAAVAGNVVSSSTAHINFNTQTPTVANAGTVDLSAGTLKAICGGGSGSAHCIVDITGYYV